MNTKPINRVNKFFGEDEFKFEIELGLEFLESDLNSVITLYQVDKEKTQVDDLYGEAFAEEIKVKPPIEIPAFVFFEPASNESYADGRLRFEEYGNLNVSFYLKTLNDLNVDICYGDYVSYQIDEDTNVYFQVTNDNQKHFNNRKMMGAYKPYYRTVTCVPTDSSEFLR